MENAGISQQRQRVLSTEKQDRYRNHISQKKFPPSDIALKKSMRKAGAAIGGSLIRASGWNKNISPIFPSAFVNITRCIELMDIPESLSKDLRGIWIVRVSVILWGVTFFTLRGLGGSGFIRSGARRDGVFLGLVGRVPLGNTTQDIAIGQERNRRTLVSRNEATFLVDIFLGQNMT